MMKYIVISLGGEETIHIFDPCFDHDRMLEAIKTVKMGCKAPLRRSLRIGGCACVGAGFIRNSTCYGKSQTLGISSREHEDTELLARKMS